MFLKNKTGTSLKFSAKFKATTNELCQEKTQLKCYEVFLLTSNCHKICLNKFIIEQVTKKQSKIQNEM